MFIGLISRHKIYLPFIYPAINDWYKVFRLHEESYDKKDIV